MRRILIVLAVAARMLLLPLLAAENPAKLVVYFPWDSPQRGRLAIFFDDARAAEVQPGKFFVIQAEPGRHMLMAGDGIPLAVEAHAGGDLFVRVARQIEIGPSGKTDIPVLEVQSPEQARLDMIHLVYVSPDKIFAASVSKEDPFPQQRPKLKSRGSAQ